MRHLATDSIRHASLVKRPSPRTHILACIQSWYSHIALNKAQTKVPVQRGDVPVSVLDAALTQRIVWLTIGNHRA